MNKVKGVVKKVLTEPQYKHNKWCIDVKYNSYGNISEKTLMFSSKEKAQQVDKGYSFLT